MGKNKTATDNQQRTAFRNRARSSNGNRIKISEARNLLSASLFDESVEWMIKSLKISPPLKNPFPKKAQDLGLTKPLEPVSFNKEVSWTCALIKQFSTQINDFIEKKNIFQSLLLKGNARDCQNIIDDICSNFGFSFWLIEHSIATKQIFEGIEGNKKLASEIRNSFSARSINRYIVNKISVRNEPSVTFSRFVAQLKKEIEGLPLESGWKKIIEYHVLKKDLVSLEDALEVLRYSSTTSIIDLYESFVYLAKIISSDKRYAAEAKIIIRQLNQINASIDDPRISSLLFFLTNGISGSLAHYDINSYEEYFSTEKTESFKDILNTEILHAGAYVQFATLGKMVFPALSLNYKIANYLVSILAKIENVDYSVSEINKLSLILPGVEVISIIQAIVTQEMLAIPFEMYNSGSDTADIKVEQLSQLLRYSFSSKIESNPFLFRFIPHPLPEQIARHCINKKVFGFIEFSGINNQSGEEPIFIQLEDILSKAQYHWHAGEFNTVINLGNELGEFDNLVYQMAALRLVTYSLIRTGRIKECIQLAASNYIINPYTRYVLPIVQLTDRIDKHMRREMGGDLSLPILYSIYSRHFDEAYDSAYSQSVINVLRNSKVLKPSSLRTLAQNFNIESLVYFLEYCCLPNIYRKSGAFEGTRELYLERIEILNWLVELNPNEADLYNSQAIDLTRKIVLMARRAEVEQSRIELNLDSFLKEADKSVRENYDRYIAIRALNVNADNEYLNEQEDDTSSVPLLPNPEPKDEGHFIFLNVVRELLAIFIGDLDRFLSTSIRHTVLESELLSPLVNSNLVTLRDSQEQYKFNDYWLKELRELNRFEADAINSTLVEFVSEYDKLVSEIKDKWVHIRFGNNNKGYIKFRIDLSTTDYIENAIGRLCLPFVPFAMAMFRIFSNDLEPGLVRIQHNLNTIGKSSALKLVDALEAQLIANNECPIELINAARDVRASIPRAFDRVVSWFKLGHESSSDPLPLDHVIEISTEIMKHYNHRFEASVTLNNAAGILVKAVFIKAYTDVFINLFTNVMMRAGLGEHPAVKVDGQIIGDNVRISVENQIGLSVSIEQIIEKINDIKDKMTNESYRNSLRGEGGTGLLRIFDILRGFRTDPQLVITILDRTFKVAFNLPTT